MEKKVIYLEPHLPNKPIDAFMYALRNTYKQGEVT